MRRILVWGLGAAYESKLNQLFFEREKSNIEILGIACEEKDRYCARKDGFPVIPKQNIQDCDFDYLINTESHHHKKIKEEMALMGIDKNKIIDGRVLHLPYFDFDKYSRLKENPVTILSDDCWSGYIYHRLDLPFTSPLINILWDRSEYSKFIKNPLFYLQSDLQLIREGSIEDGLWPIAALGEGKTIVKMQLVHHLTFEDALEQWNRRKARINYNNLFVKMGFSGKIENKEIREYISAFNSVNYNKILFFYKNMKGAFKSDRFIWKLSSGPRVETFDYNAYCINEYFWDLNMFDLLLGEKNYSRYL